MLFMLISIFEISRGMWMYHTLAYALKQATRYAAVHGQNCAPAVNGNSCLVQVKDIALVLLTQGGGLIPESTVNGVTTKNLNLRLCAPGSGDVETCNAPPAAAPATYPSHTCFGNDCLTDTTPWPPAGSNRVGLDDVAIAGNYPFGSVLAFLWPGVRSPAMNPNLPTLRLPASARERVEFGGSK